MSREERSPTAMAMRYVHVGTGCRHLKSRPEPPGTADRMMRSGAEGRESSGGSGKSGDSEQVLRPNRHWQPSIALT
jgi:hypothetical protein